jgi:hexosaminidase
MASGLKTFNSALTVALSATAVSANTVFPKPFHQVDSSTLLALDAVNFQFSSAPGGPTNDILTNAFERYYAIALRQSNSLLPEEVEEVKGLSNGIVDGVEVTLGTESIALTLETNVSYSLTVTAPKVKIEAANVFGAMNALESFSQLVNANGTITGTKITDKPRYQFRASMIDTSRHYYPVEVILQHLDAMSYAKMNVLHWHIVDSISFPYESEAFPEMAAQGAYSPSHTYSRTSIKQVIEYAKNRGIRVIPEFDTPGHVQQGYQALDPPVLTPCYSGGKPDGTTGPLNPTTNATYDFLKKFYKEIQDLFPDKFVHVGGDEVSFDCWESNPEIQAFMKAHPEISDYAALEQYYELQLLNILKDQNTSYICWQEIFDNGVKILPDTVVDVWKGGNWQQDMAAVAQAGYHSVLSAPFYLNYISYGEDWPKYYSVEPSNFTGGAEADKNGLIGGLEVCMWSEYVDATNFISRIWPRAAAVAERAWSAKDVTDVNDARYRIAEFRCKLLDRGIGAEPITNGGSSTELEGHNFCPQEWNVRYTPPWSTR